MDNVRISPFTALCLRVAGLVMIFTGLLDYLFIAIPDASNPQWQLAFTTQSVDRGITPLLGIVFLATSYWLQSATATQGEQIRQPRWRDLRFLSLLLSALFGFLFVALIPLHLLGLQSYQSDILSKLDQQSTPIVGQLSSQLEQLQKLKDEKDADKKIEDTLKQISAILQTGSLNGETLTADQLGQVRQRQQELSMLKQLKGDPKALDEQIAQLKKQQEALQKDKEAEVQRTKRESLSQGARVGLRSLILAIGYIFIAWSGLRGYSSRLP